jgi:hypothetical protein
MYCLSILTGFWMIDKKRRRIIKIGSFISLLIIFFFVSIIIYYQHQPYGTPPRHLIINGNLTIKAYSYKAFNFTIPMDITQCQVNGDFAVYPTNSSGLRVFIWDTAAFNNWQSGHFSLDHARPGEVISLYDSGHSNNGTIDIFPGSGTYFLLFLNNSTETVNVTVEADYWYIQG